MKNLPKGKLNGTAKSIVALLLVAVAGCSTLRRPGPTVDRSEDARIVEDVRARLSAERILDASQIRVEVDGRVVRLHGSVTGMGQWQCALRNAELVPGVATVVDYLLIERGPREAQCLAVRATR